MTSVALQSQELTLPLLREDLQFVQTAPTHEGVPTWAIIDPIRNRYFQIGWGAYQLLSRWTCESVEALIETVTAATTCQVSKQDVEDLVRFLYANNLTRDSATGDSKAYVAQVEAGRKHWLIWLIHNYLFIRIPLVRPDRFLKATMPYVRPLLTVTAARIVVIFGLVGLYLAGRQWEAFFGTFLHFFSAEGLVLWLLALGVLKVLHELGHAYAAAHYGCRVTSMGVAFLVMFPVLYTDTTEAWKLRSRRQRILINAAGTITELGMASLATFSWSFLPDGPFRSIAFVVATTSWVMGLMINLNPFMRFDGYYLASDWLGVPNLQERSFAMGLWRLRQLLFAIDVPPPEQLSVSLRTKLIIYAWGTWIYRFFLFLGIAVLVYYFFFKLLGIILFVVEILWFIVLPILRELREWWKMRHTITQTSRFWVTASVFLTLVVLLVIPWPTRVSIPAVLDATPRATLYAPAPGRIVEVSVYEGQQVTEGQVLLTLEAPEVEKDIELARKRIEVLELRALRKAASEDERARNRVIVQALRSRISELRGLMEQRGNLVLKAPISGVVMDTADSLHPGRWINKKLELAYVIDPEQRELQALAPMTEVRRLDVGQTAKFIPDDAARPTINATVREIRLMDEGEFKLPYLASIFGGEIAVRVDKQGKLRPESSVYRVELEVDGDAPRWDQAVRGMLHIDGRPQSVAHRLWDQIAAVLIRESGF